MQERVVLPNNNEWIKSLCRSNATMDCSKRDGTNHVKSDSTWLFLFR